MRIAEQILARVGLDARAVENSLASLVPLTRALRADPTRTEYWAAVGTLQWFAERSPRAVRALRNACAQDPSDRLSRAFLGRCLLELGSFTEGATLHRERWLTPGLSQRMRYPANLMWSGECGSDRSVLLWGDDDLDDGFALLRLAPMLSSSTAAVAVDLPPLPLAIVRSCWPQLDPLRASGKFSAHFPLGDLVSLWRAPDPALLQSTSLPLPVRLEFERRVETVVGVCVDAAVTEITVPALVHTVRSGGGKAAVMSPTDGWQLERDRQPVEHQANAILRNLAEVDALVTTSAMMAHLAGLANKPVVYLADAGAGWCWGAGGRSAWYLRSQVLRRPIGGSWRQLLTYVPGAIEIVLAQPGL